MENSILLDGDIKNIREKVATSDLRTSVEKTRQIIRDFRWTVDLMIKQNRNVTLSYSYYDTAQLKIQAKPAAISPFEEAFTLSEDAGYFSDRRIPLSKDEANGLIYYSGKLSGSRQIDNQKEEGLGDLEALRISATRAETLIQCPYRFALENIIDMEIEERVIDITRWLDPMEMGTLCHQIFANYHQQTEKSATIEDDNLLMDKIYKDVVDSWLTRKPPSVDPQRQLKEIKTITQNYVILKNSYGKNNFLAAERLFEAAELIPEKLSIYGRADLVEENLEGLTVVDVKTGRRVGQTDQDIKTCIQAILYCLLLEREGNSIPVTGGYYLYPRTQRVVSCDYNLEAQEKAVDLLKQAINAIETGNGWKTDEKEVCEYCAYEKICNQKNKRRFFQRLIEEGVIS
jgi:RecB family exonuclease